MLEGRATTPFKDRELFFISMTVGTTIRAAIADWGKNHKSLVSRGVSGGGSNRGGGGSKSGGGSGGGG